MKQYGTEHKRLIGQWRIKIKGYKISIEDNWHINCGLIYPSAVTRWACNGEQCQVIGMDNSYGLTKRGLAYIHAYIRKHYKDIAKS